MSNPGGRDVLARYCKELVVQLHFPGTREFDGRPIHEVCSALDGAAFLELYERVITATA